MSSATEFDHVPAEVPAIRWPDDAPFGVWLTHDVDRVRKTYQYATDLLTRHRVPDFRPLVRGDDPYFNFHRVVEQEESLHVRSTFFFLEESIRLSPAPRTWPIALGKYRFAERKVAGAIRYLRTKGWEVGLHGSYRSYTSEDLLRKEKNSLESVVGEPVLAVRQHYLNLAIPSTWRLQENVGFKLDSSLGRMDAIGFHANGLWPFHPEGLTILEVPLVVPDAAVLRSEENGEDPESRLDGILALAARNHALVTVLWHQRFLNPSEFPLAWRTYLWLIKEAKRLGGWFGLGRDLLPMWSSDHA